MEQFLTYTVVYKQENDFQEVSEDYHTTKSPDQLIQFILSTIINNPEYTVYNIYKQDMKTQAITYLNLTYSNYTLSLEDK